MKLIKHFYFQLGILVFIYLLFLISLGNSIAITFFVALLLCAGYIITNERQHKWASWFRIILFAVLAYYLYGFLTTLSISIRFTKLFHPGITNLQLAKAVYFDFFWSLLLMGIICFVLIFNKPVQGWLKKLIGRFR